MSWKSVNCELPEDTRGVDDDSLPDIKYWVMLNPSRKVKIKTPRFGYLRDGVFCNPLETHGTHRDYSFSEQPTHWMHLPELPDDLQ